MPSSTYLANGLINYIYRGQAFTAPSTYWIALHSANPTAAGLLATELTGGSYVRLEASFTSPSSGSSTNETELFLMDSQVLQQLGIFLFGTVHLRATCCLMTILLPLQSMPVMLSEFRQGL